MIGDSQHVQDKEGKTALMHALTNTRDLPENIIEQIIGDFQHLQDKEGKTALIHALTNTRVLPENLIKQMIGDSQHVQDKEGKTALMYAMISKCVISDNLIIKVIGISQNIQDNDGKTALMHAQLISESLHIRDNIGKTALMYAMKHKCNLPDHLIKQMISDSLQIQDNEGKTALMYAMQHKCYLPDHLMKQMISDSQHIQDNEGKTALMYAMKHKYDLPNHLMKEMICDTQFVKDKKGKTALMHASQSSHFPNPLIINLFNRDLLNVQDIFGKTALHYAIEDDQNDEYLKHLISHGANLEVQDNNGRTALILCLEFDIQENVFFNLWTEKFLKTKQFLQYNPIPSVRHKEKLFLFTSIEKEMFSLMNLYKNKEILRLMLANGIVPFPNSCSKFSMLLGALKHNLIDVATYVIANVCMTYDDLKMLNYANNCLNSNCIVRSPPSVYNLNGLDLSSPDLRDLVIGATSQPWPLVKLSFLAVNSALGNGVKREQRIKMLPLPEPIKDMLMFNTRTALLPVSHWIDIPMVFDPAQYEKTSKPRPLLNYWPFGEVLVV
ncbi:unnamed protein product [Lymnaea stagnalis]|uniref:Uncharacterized protein n=1 Tax=Lymnaea stagnalis TaxID=6523 RepID=A0AAV2HUL9_LYMST